MQENQDKKINYKILTAEEILKEVQVPKKEIEHHEEKVEVPVTEKIDKKFETPSTEKIKERIEIIETEKKEAGVLYPEFKEEPIELEPTYKPTYEIEKKVEIKGPEPIITQPIEKKEELKPQIQEKVPEKPKKEVFYFKPEEKLKPIKEIEKTEKKEKTKFKLIYLLIPGTLVIILSLIFFLKSHQPEKAEETIQTTTTISAPPQFSFPKIVVSTQTPETKITETETKITETETKTAPTSTITQVVQIETFPSKEINLPGIIKTVQKNEFENFLFKQEPFGTKLNINLIENNKKLPVDFLFDYFIKTKNSNELKNELTGNYGFLIYYGYVRKYPILVFEIKDKNKVLKFNQTWEKTTMKNDLQSLFLDSQPPKTKNKFETRKIDNFSYRILYFGDNYKIIWSIVNNYLIYSTTETGLEEIIDYLK